MIPPGANATDKELADVWRPFAANAGTYDIKGNELTTRPMVAKNPGVMAAGAFNTATIRFDGNDTLVMVTKGNPQGPVANPLTIKLTRVE